MKYVYHPKGRKSAPLAPNMILNKQKGNCKGTVVSNGQNPCHIQPSSAIIHASESGVKPFIEQSIQFSIE